jgi:hypothetical protein
LEENGESTFENDDRVFLKMLVYTVWAKLYAKGIAQLNTANIERALLKHVFYRYAGSSERMFLIRMIKWPSCGTC